MVPHPLLELATIREAGEWIVIRLLRHILQLLHIPERDGRHWSEHREELGFHGCHLRLFVTLHAYHANELVFDHEWHDHERADATRRLQRAERQSLRFSIRLAHG